MRKKIALIICVLMTISITGCGADEINTTQPNEKVQEEHTSELIQPSESADSYDTDVSLDTSKTETPDTNILIAYFTWAENTDVEHPEEVDVDATTSASVIPPGNAALLGSWIQNETGGDVFQIITVEPYSSDYDECLDRAADEKADNARPALTAKVENMDEYDIAFLGYPDWWSTCPMAIFTFLEQYDFSGKTVIPFCTHGTSGFGSSLNDLKDALPDSTILEAFGAYRPEVADLETDTTEWVRSLGIEY